MSEINDNNCYRTAMGRTTTNKLPDSVRMCFRFSPKHCHRWSRCDAQYARCI